MTKIPFVIQQVPSGCIICTSHKLNADGYLRIRKDGKLMMAHRAVWEDAHGVIPDGYEIDHICKNRACFNLSHLQMLEGREHTIKGNRERYATRFEKAKKFWGATTCSGRVLGEHFGVSNSAACRWITQWKREVTANGTS